MRRLIINADDFGLTRQVNQGIRDAHCDGMVTSTSLMANGQAFVHAIALASRAPGLSVGVHLSLTQGSPVSPPSAIPTLVDAQGRFCRSAPEFLKRIVTRRINLRDIEIELRAQIVKVLRTGIFPTHLDGHMHLHVIPGVSEVVLRLAQEFRIPSVRCPKEPLALSFLPHSLRRAAPRAFRQIVTGRAIAHFARGFRPRLAAAGLTCTDHFCGLGQTGFLDGASLAALLRRLPEGSTELMCHPGYADAALAETGTRLVAQRAIECRALMSPKIRRVATSEGIELISYGDFARGWNSIIPFAQHAEIRTATRCA